MPKVNLTAFPLTPGTNIPQQHKHSQKCVCCGETHLPQHEVMDAWEKFVPTFRASVDVKNQLCAGFAFPDVTWKKMKQDLKCGVHLAKGGILSCSWWCYMELLPIAGLS